MKNENETNKENNQETQKLPGNWAIERRRIVLPGWDKDDKKIIEDQYKITHINVVNKICLIDIDGEKFSRNAVMSLKELETLLDPDLFFHAGRAHNFNMRFGKSFRYNGRCITATLVDEITNVPVSYRQVKDFKIMADNFQDFNLKNN